MEDSRKFYGTTPREADVSLASALILLGSMLLSFARYGDSWGIVLFSVPMAMLLAWRLVKGPMVGPAFAEITGEMLVFRDRAFFRTREHRFPLAEIAEIRLVGLLRARQIRVVLRSGVERTVVWSAGHPLAQRVIEFLRENIPKDLPLTEAEPPSWSAWVRGDY